MCLSNLDQTFKPALKEERIGYKVMMKEHSYIQTYSSLCRMTFLHYVIGKWYSAEKKEIKCCGPWNMYTRRYGKAFSYESGFHIFRSYYAAEKFRAECGGVIVMVKYTGITSSGRQDGYVDVARRMCIIGEMRNRKLQV